MESKPKQSRQQRRKNERDEKKLENKKLGNQKKSVVKNGSFEYNENLVEEGKDISISEKRGILDVVKQYEVDTHVMKDPNSARVPLQNVALVSFLSPFTNQECRSTQKQPKLELEAIFKKYRIPVKSIQRIWNIIHDELSMSIKVRGCFENEKDANEHIKLNIGVGDRIDHWLLDMYEYKLVPPNKYADRERLETHYGDEKTEEFYTAHIKQQEQAKKEKETRIANFKRKMDKENEEKLKNPQHEETKEDELVKKLREFQKDPQFNEIVKTEILAQLREATERSGMDLNEIITQIKNNDEKDTKGKNVLKNE